MSGVAGQPVCVLYCAAFVWRDRESEMAQGESGDGGRYTGFGGPSTSIKRVLDSEALVRSRDRRWMPDDARSDQDPSSLPVLV